MSISRAKRWRVPCPVQLVSQDFFDESKTADVSLRGVSVATARSLQLGTQLYVRLLLPDRTSSVDYKMCTVRWVAEGRIGLEASELTTEDEQRLRTYLSSLTHFPEPMVEYSNPCITVEQPVDRISDAMGIFWQVFVKPLIVLDGSSQSSASTLQKHEHNR
jgi:hypothetical protein